MKKITSIMLSLTIFTVLMLFANTYSGRPSANANSDVYEQVLFSGNNVTTNFPQQQLPFVEPTAPADIVNPYQIPSQPILPSQQQLPFVEPTAPADIVNPYQIPSQPILPSQQQLPFVEPTAPADIVNPYQIPSQPILPSQQQLPFVEPTAPADIVNPYQIPSQPILPSQQQLPFVEPTAPADIVNPYQIPSQPILPSQQQLPFVEPTAPADIVNPYQIPSQPILPSQQQLPFVEPTAPADIVNPYQIPSQPILLPPNNFGQYPTSPTYDTLIPEPFTSQFPYSYQIQQQEDQRPFNASIASAPSTSHPSSSANPSTTGNEIFEDGSIGTENSRDLNNAGLQGRENILDADSSPYRTNDNYTVQSTTSHPTGPPNGFQPFIFSSTPADDDNPSLTLVPQINSTQNPFPNLSQSSQYVYSGDTTNFDNARNNAITDSPLSNITKTNSQAPSSSGVTFNLTRQDKPSPVFVENDTISSSTPLASITTPISEVQNVTLSNVTSPYLRGATFNSTDPFSNETNSTTILQSRGTSLPSDAVLFNSTAVAFLPPNSTAIASTMSDGFAPNQDNETSASCNLQVALNEPTASRTGSENISGTTIQSLATSSSTSSCEPELAESGNTTYVTWTEGDEEDRQIFFAKSTDGGDTFAETVPLSNYAPSGSFNPQLAVSGNNVYVVWQEDDAITGNQDIFFKKSTDGGNSFTDDINLSNDPGGSGDPQIHVSGRNLYIVWDGTTPGANGIFLSKSTDGGDTFSSTAKLSNDRGISFLPKIGKVLGNDIEIMWRNSENANDQVFSRKSIDGGASFTSIQKLSDEIKNRVWEEFSSHLNEIPFNSVVPR